MQAVISRLKKKKRFQCAMDRRAGASWQAVMKHCDLKFGRLRAAWPAELDGFLERMEGGFKLKKKTPLFFLPDLAFTNCQ